METILSLLAIGVHLYFLYYVWVNVSMGWALGCLLLPILCLWIYYREWYRMRTIFFAELAIFVAVVVLN